jgi:hypothetical protein
MNTKIEQAWQWTPNFVKILLLVLSLWLGVSIYLLSKKSEASNTEYLELAKQKTELDYEIQQQAKRIEIQDSTVQVLIHKYSAIDQSKTEQVINKKYENKKSIIADLPIDSTVSNLTEWLK